MLITDVQYPGINGILSAQAVISQGISPGRATITTPASTIGTLDPIGDLSMSDGSNTVVWAGCRVAHFAFAGGSGQAPTATILLEDFRWKWSGGQISGRYNVPAEYFNTVPLISFPGSTDFANQNFTQVPFPPEEQPIRPETAKTARELCELCLKAMGVKEYDVSPIDPKSYPSVEWDSEVPARALQSLVERYGCRVVPNPTTGAVAICKEGFGTLLPDGAFLFDSPSLTPKPVPKVVNVRTGYIRYQMRFALEMVLMEFDGSWKPADQVSYRPKGGWTGYVTAQNLVDTEMPNLPAGRTMFDAQAIAGAYLYRAYRVSLTKADGKGVLRIPADGGEKDRCDFHKQIYLLPNKVQVTKDDLNRHSPAPAQVFGRHTNNWSRGLANPVILYDLTTADTEVIMPFSIDSEHAIIIFAQPVYAFKTDGKVYPAEIVLETACHFAGKDFGPDPWQFRRRTYSRNIPEGLSDLPSYVVKNELLATSVAEYSTDNTLSKVTENNRDLQPRADYYLNGEVLKLATDAAQTRTYSGVVQVYPDGLIQQVSIEFAAGDKNKPATTASAGTEHSVYLPNYEGRRLREEADLRSATRDADTRAAHDRQQKEDAAGFNPL